jgi:hypothetical protein
MKIDNILKNIFKYKKRIFMKIFYLGQAFVTDKIGKGIEDVEESISE